MTNESPGAVPRFQTQTLRFADVVAGGLLLVLGAAFLVASFQIAGGQSVQQGLHPSTLPALVSGLLALSGLGLAVGAARSPLADKVVEWPGGPALRYLLMTLVSMVALLALLESLGFPLAILVYLSFAVWYLGRYHPVAVLGLAALTAAAVYLVFSVLLGLSFPLGPLGS